ncbi:O-antigen ligase like membrane protein [Zhouia amylolytica]|uniref:O-antigen ligase like membrane protein n=1 Tax=Zhouia amylolytica TaxID=376730 RepID=A0A1I6QRY1_9FLAO|nr:O-antigen ligase family protein [Zhouia amylolytica]SFS55246.1 O-antigen ligase like membrane protein [Zhouia amylolytica]
MFSQKLFFSVMIIFLFLQVGYHYSQYDLIKYILYSLEITLLFIGFNFFLKNKVGKEAYGGLKYLMLISSIFIVNYTLNGLDGIVDSIKIFGAIIIFLATTLIKLKPNILKRDKIKVIIMSGIPLLVVIMDKIIGFQESDKSLSIFVNSNNYIFFAICCCWLMLLCNVSKKIVLVYILISFAITSTLGALLSICIATLFYLRKRVFKLKYFLLSVLLILVGMILFDNSDLYLFQRVRGTMNVVSNLLSNYKFSQLSEVGFGEAMKISGSSDGSDVSFLFRIKIWTEILAHFLNQGIENILFGIGFGQIPNVNSFGLVAHNDYLTWLVEFGLFGFLTIIVGLITCFKKLKNTVYIIPYLTILIYFFSENLFYNFFGIVLFAYCTALSIKKNRNESITN